MTAYQFEIIMILGLAALLLWQYPSVANKKIFCTLVTIQWIVLSGFRHLKVGNDTAGYKSSFERVLRQDWGTLFDNFTRVFFKGEEGKDPGYYLFVKFTQIFLRDNYQLYLILIAMLFFIPLGIWLYKYSKEPCISALIMSTLFWGFFGITGIRQTIATALVVLMGYKFIRERRLLPFTLLILIAGTIHKSAFFFFPFYFLAYKKITKKYITAVVFAIPIVFILRNHIFGWLSSFIGYEQYADAEGSSSWFFAPTFVAVFGVALWRMKEIFDNNPDAVIYYNALFIAVIFIPLMFVNSSPMRIIQYYSLFILLLIPEIICSFEGQEQVICYSVSAGVLLALFFRGSKNYMFFWQ